MLAAAGRATSQGTLGYDLCYRGYTRNKLIEQQVRVHHHKLPMLALDNSITFT